MKKAKRKNSRANFPPKIEAEILFACKRRCAFCYTLAGDASVKMNGQIAHIDKSNANNAPSNAAYLCLVHHDEYDSRRSQSKGLTKDELLRCQEYMLKNLTETLWIDTSMPKHTKKRKGKTSLAVYKVRIAMYQTTVEFLRLVSKDLSPPNRDILQFARDTEEALFQFDDSISEYLALLFRKALRLHAVDRMRSAQHPPDNLQELIEEQTALSLWFVDQYDVVRSKFAPFLKLADSDS